MNLPNTPQERTIRQILEGLVHLPYDAHQKDIDQALKEIQSILLYSAKPDSYFDSDGDFYRTTKQAIDEYRDNINEVIQ